MSEASMIRDPVAIEILLSALEAPRPRLSAEALQSFPPSVRAELLAAELIKPEGHEGVVTSPGDHDDRPVALQWCSDEQSYGYFSRAVGWVSVSPADIVQYRVDVLRLLAALTSEVELCPGRRDPSTWVNDSLWQIGNARFG